jgi:ubiquinone/menaquinone biosynthesis C-methylase UbiE
MTYAPRAMHTAEAIRSANSRYHDLAAPHYDEKWGITFDRVGEVQVTAKLRKALGHDPGVFPRALEIGAGTGYFGLNLVLAGVVETAVATDISPGMLRSLERSAADLGLEVETAACDAASLPFADGSFDLVFGHAVLHHLPDLGAAFREFRRVLRPGGAIAFCGEPSHRGHRRAAVPKRGALAVAPLWRAVLGAAARRNGASNGGRPSEEEILEQVVDVHAFTPRDLAGPARVAGFERVRVRGEELVAGLFGWANRTLEATAEPNDVPWAWRVFAYRGYLALQALDRSLLEPRLPAGVFYNLLVSARSPV